MAGGRRYVVSIAGRSLQVEVVETPDGAAVLVDGRRYPAELSPGQGAGPRRLSVGGSRHDLLLMVRDDVISLAIDGVALDATIQDERAARLASFGGGRTRQAGRASVTAPMPGLVVRIPVEAGQSVEAGQVVVVLQAMKMENELGSPRAGTIARVNVAASQPVEQGQVLVELE